MAKNAPTGDVAKKTGLKEVKKIAKQTNKKIEKGLSNPKASTGTPINALSGGAKIMAVTSNIGGGSKATGGKGVIDGLNTIMQNQAAKAILKTAKQLSSSESENKKISSKKK